MEKFCWWGGGVALTITVGIVIAKAQVSPNIWYGWILREPHVVPVLIVLMIGFWAVALGQHAPINRAYRWVFSFLFDRNPTPETKPQQWRNAERERLKPEIEEWKTKWETEHSGLSERDETIKKLKTENTSLNSRADDLIEGNIAAQQQAAAMRYVLWLKLVPWEIKRIWPDADFLIRPANSALWLPPGDSKLPCPWLTKALAWLEMLPKANIGNSDYLASLSFDELMDHIDQMAALRGGGNSPRLHQIPDNLPEVRITKWGERTPGDSRCGLFINVTRAAASQIRIVPFRIGKYIVTPEVIDRPLTEQHGEVFVEVAVTRHTCPPDPPDTGWYLLKDLVGSLRESGLRTSHGTLINVPLTVIYSGPSIVTVMEGRHELDAMGGFIRYFGRYRIEKTS